MDIKCAKKIITNVLSKDRVEHSFRVAKVATQLARKYNVNIEKIELAAILHDYAKNHSKEELKRWILQSSLPKNLLFYHSAIWHGPVGALMLKQKYGISNQNVLSAIYCHTTGKEKMSLIDKIIFVSDYIEPARKTPGIEEVREAAETNLDLAAYLILRNTIHYLMSKQYTIYPDTFYAYNELVEINRRDGGLNNI